MAIREIRGRHLLPGHVLALPMGRSVTIKEVKKGTRYVRYWWQDADGKHYQNRVELTAPVLIEDGTV